MSKTRIADRLATPHIPHSNLTNRSLATKRRTSKIISDTRARSGNEPHSRVTGERRRVRAGDRIEAVARARHYFWCRSEVCEP
jgi:hypothetical protein